MNVRTGKPATLFTGLLIGGLVGAGVAILTAPRSGEETRSMIRQKSIELKDRAASSLEETRTKAGEIKQRGQAALSEQASGVKQAIQGMRERLPASAKGSEVSSPSNP